MVGAPRFRETCAARTPNRQESDVVSGSEVDAARPEAGSTDRMGRSWHQGVAPSSQPLRRVQQHRSHCTKSRSQCVRDSSRTDLQTSGPATGVPSMNGNSRRCWMPSAAGQIAHRGLRFRRRRSADADRTLLDICRKSFHPNTRVASVARVVSGGDKKATGSSASTRARSCAATEAAPLSVAADRFVRRVPDAQVRPMRRCRGCARAPASRGRCIGRSCGTRSGRNDRT